MFISFLFLVGLPSGWLALTLPSAIYFNPGLLAGFFCSLKFHFLHLFRAHTFSVHAVFGLFRNPLPLARPSTHFADPPPFKVRPQATPQKDHLY